MYGDDMLLTRIMVLLMGALDWVRGCCPICAVDYLKSGGVNGGGANQNAVRHQQGQYGQPGAWHSNFRNCKLWCYDCGGNCPPWSRANNKSCFVKKYWEPGKTDRVCRACIQGTEVCNVANPSQCTQVLKNLSRPYLIHLLHLPAKDAALRLEVVSGAPFAWWTRKGARQRATGEDQTQFNRWLLTEWHGGISWCTLLFLYETGLIDYQAGEGRKYKEVIGCLIVAYFDSMGQKSGAKAVMQTN